MTPETIVIDRVFRGVGRIKRASGTTNVTVRNRINTLLTKLFEEGRLDILRAIRDGQLSMLEVYSASQRKTLDKLAIGDTARNLSEAMRAWIESLQVPHEASQHHKDSLETSRRYFANARPKAQVAQIAEVLEGLRDSLGRDYPRSFNLARAAALAFTRSTLKKTHPLWLACSAVEPRKLRSSTKHEPLSVAQMQGFFPAPESDPVDAIAWGMATTGMGAEEYWGKWETRADRIHIGGTKRKGRVRDVPLVRVPAVPSMHRRTFENKVRERSRSFKVYDLRRTYANWLEAAGVPRTRRKLYMGHGAGDVTGLYELHEVTAFLAEDAAKIKAMLKIHPTESHTIKLVKEESA